MLSAGGSALLAMLAPGSWGGSAPAMAVAKLPPPSLQMSYLRCRSRRVARQDLCRLPCRYLLRLPEEAARIEERGRFVADLKRVRALL